MEKTRIVLALCVLFVSCFSTAIADDSLDSDITLLGRWQVGSCMALDVEGDLACYADGAFLQTADVSDPYAPVTMGGVLLPMAIWGMDVVGSMAYVSPRAWAPGRPRRPAPATSAPPRPRGAR